MKLTHKDIDDIFEKALEPPKPRPPIMQRGATNQILNRVRGGQVTTPPPGATIERNR